MESVVNRFSLKGKTAIVTGAGKGIGRATALAFAEAGANIVCAARTQEDLDKVAEQAKSLGAQALAISCNVAKSDQLKNLVDKTMAEFGQVDILVNNAGGAMPNDALQTTPEQFDRDYHFNVTTAFELTQLVAPGMIERNTGSIINITSAAARYSQKGFSSYGTVKAALTQLTKLLAADFAPHIRVNGIAPGTIMTGALEMFLDDEAKQKMTDLTPLAALGQPEDIAAAALYLASPAAGWVSGKIIEVDGGAEKTTWPF